METTRERADTNVEPARMHRLLFAGRRNGGFSAGRTQPAGYAEPAGSTEPSAPADTGAV
jgi:hypothetical protein